MAVKHMINLQTKIRYRIIDLDRCNELRRQSWALKSSVAPRPISHENGIVETDLSSFMFDYGIHMQAGFLWPFHYEIVLL
jgi:hypothetical protein